MDLPASDRNRRPKDAGWVPLKVACLERRGHKFLPGPNSDIYSALTAGLALPDCVTAVAVESPPGRDLKASVTEAVNALSLCFEFSLERLYLPKSNWLPEPGICIESAGEVIVLNGQDGVFPEEGIIWWGDFSSLAKLCSKPSPSCFAAAVAALQEFATSEQARRIFNELSPDCPLRPEEPMDGIRG